MMTSSNKYVLAVLLLVMCCLYESDQKLYIQSPPQLADYLKTKHPNGIPFSIANYGSVPFGTSLSGTIYLPSVLQNCRNQPLTDPQADKKVNKIVMSIRGDCTFTTKSLHSQKQGAKMAIIADNVVTEDPGRIILVDDGRGPQIDIPTIFIEEQLGQIIVQYVVQKNQHVKILFRFETNQKPIANVDLWMNSFDRKSYMLIRQLQPYFSRIQQKMQLRLYHPTSACRTCLQTDCYGDKQYCINTGFYGIAIPNLGQQIIKQQLRQQIIMQQYYHNPSQDSTVKNNKDNLWWKYMEAYDDQCEDKMYISQCAVDTMKKVGINQSLIEQAVQKSFYTTPITDTETNVTRDIVDNKLLQKNSDLRRKAGLVLYPTIVVNNITYRGNLDGLDIFEMICNSFTEQPEACQLQVQQPNTPWRIIIPLIVFFLVFMIFLLACYRRRVRRQLSKDINKQVNQLVNQYITMYESHKFETQTG